MNNIRQLRDYFVPENYQLHLDIDKLNRQYSGVVTITGQPLKDTVRLHSVDLEIISIRDNDGDLPWQIIDNEIIINKPSPKITIQFAGHISETAMNGLYLCKYKYQGQNRELFATQFESHYARRCFPCIDEPAAKATFDVSLTTNDPNDTIMLSNMPGKLKDNVWVFDQTPLMSTYLLAFVGGNLQSKSATTKNGVVVSTYTTPDKTIDQLDFSLQTAVKALEYYEDYFQTPYPLPKLDNVALPDFSTGAMENWGLITYRQSAMLVEKNSAPSVREFVSVVVTHEIAHQWFGNLVTIEWWNDLWLNESFASLMENMATDHLYPDFHIWRNDLAFAGLNSKTKDSIAGVQAVRQDIDDVEEISTLFDSAIVYAKGLRLLRMLYTLIGEDAFRRGLADYFKAHAYGNTTANDLWNAWTKYAKIDVADFMNPWLNQPGLPMLTVSRQGDKVHLSQSILTTDSQPSPTIWPVPLFMDQNSDTLIMTKPEMTLPITNQSDLAINPSGIGHYVVNYDEPTLAKLVSDYDKLPIIQRINIIQDVQLLTMRNKIDILPLLNILKNIKVLEDRNLMLAISRSISLIRSLVEPNSPTDQSLHQLVNDIVADTIAKLVNTPIDQMGNEAETFSAILSLALYGKNPTAISYADQLFAKYQDNLDDMPDSVRSTILNDHIYRGSTKQFTSLYQEYLNLTDSSLRDDIRDALTMSPRKADIDVILNAISKDIIRPKNVISTLSLLANNRHVNDLIWHWLKTNWQWIDEVFGQDMTVTDFVYIAANTIYTTTDTKNSASKLADYDKFFDNLKSPATARAIEVGHNSIVERFKWQAINKPVLEKALKDTK